MIDGLQDFAFGIGDNVKTFISEKPITTAIIGSSVIGVGTLGAFAVAKTRKKRKAKTKRGRARDRKFISKQKSEQAYVRRKRKAGKKITRKSYKTKSTKTTKKRVGKLYYTKKGQPYKIMASGKARFVKKTKGRKK